MINIVNIYRDFLLDIDEIAGNNNILTNHRYYKVSHSILTNKLNIHVDDRTLTLIHQFFINKKNDTMNLLDLGAGLGSKSVAFKKVFKNSNIYGLETINHDDPDLIEHKPHLFYEKIYPHLNKKYNINLGMYDGLNIPFEDNFFDIIFLYAVIEHISPENRKVFIDTISKKLKKGGYIVITRCPRFWGLMEFISRTFKLGAHPWVLKKKELLGLFDKDKYSIEIFKRMNNIPNNHAVSKYLHKILIPVDKFLDFIKWPFSTDYFLILKKID